MQEARLILHFPDAVLALFTGLCVFFSICSFMFICYFLSSERYIRYSKERLGKIRRDGSCVCLSVCFFRGRNIFCLFCLFYCDV